MLGQKNFGSKIFWVIKILGRKIFLVKIFWDKKNGQKDLDPKFFLSKKILVGLTGGGRGWWPPRK